MKRISLICGFVLLAGACTNPKRDVGNTTITKWQDGKKGTVSITYDDGSINQFRKAMPLMNELGMPGTFFINTGSFPGSTYKGTFIGRDVKEIIAETATIPTGEENYFERASAASYLGYRGTIEDFYRAGAAFDAEDPERAYQLIDELYSKVRSGGYPPREEPKEQDNTGDRITWDDLRKFAEQGHEFSSHMVTHPRLSSLDEPNALYELEKSRLEIQSHLGERHTFSAEVPFGTEHERAMEYAHRYYPALRNRMPEPWLEELNRSNRQDPGSFDREYVQEQRGALQRTHLPLMKSWIETTVAHDNVWLVLVFHGVDGIGWEALSIDTLDTYFRYIASLEDELWIATFGDVTRYMRERMNASLTSLRQGNKILVDVSHPLDPLQYDLPLTLKTYVPAGWKDVQVEQGSIQMVQTRTDNQGTYVLYRAIPGGGQVQLSRGGG
jgi:peptidoglycan/xylan/chitin deacetylase (PgdA/CDA1 family)